MNPLQQFLIKFKKNGSNKPTHTIIPDKNNKLPEIRFGSSLTVKQEDMHEFNTYIYNLFFNEKITFPLTETFNINTPLILDLDMKYTNAEKQRYYTDDTLIEL